MVYTKRTMQINAGDKVAQLLLLSYFKSKAAPIVREEVWKYKQRCFGK